MLENREFLFLLLIYRMVMVISPYKKKKKKTSESCLIKAIYVKTTTLPWSRCKSISPI